MRKRIFFILGVVTIVVVYMFMFHKLPGDGFMKDYYLGIVTVEGDETPQVSFFNESLENIGKIKLDGKDFLGIYNCNDVEQDENNFYFVKDSSIFNDSNELLKASKKNFKQTEIKLSGYPSYFFVGKDNIYAVDLLMGSTNLSVFNKKENVTIAEEKIDYELSPSIFEYKSNLYYYIRDKNKVTLYNHTNKKTELILENVNEILSTKIEEDSVYILGSFIEDNQKGEISKYILTEYNFKTKQKNNILISNNDSKYIFSNLVLYNNNIILKENVTMVIFKDKKEVLYIDKNTNKIKKILVDEYPESIATDKENLIFISKNSISIYNKDFKLIKHKKINIIKKNDYESKFNLYVLVGGKYEKK